MSNEKKTLISIYKKKINKNEITYDKKQEFVIEKLQLIYDSITRKNYLINSIINFFYKKKKIKKNGIYLWGKVGRGKTYLMDLFYNSLTIKEKKRMHFHTLMLFIHSELKKLNSHKNPIKELTKNFINSTRILCVDELYIDDITDAMLIKSFFLELFEKKITIIITSNTAANNLYKNGLQRQHFVELIRKIEIYLQIINLDNEIDYRHSQKQKKKIYYSPLTNDNLIQCFKLYVQSSNTDMKTNHNYIILNNRKIKTMYLTKTTVWFTFKEICFTPRNKNDYIVIAKNFTTVALSHIPLLMKKDYQAAKRFISLIDELYEKKTKIIILSEKTIPQINLINTLNFEFNRLISRTTEMQTLKYLNEQHYTQK